MSAAPTTIWVHDEAISRDHPVFEEAGANARSVFIFDADEYRRRGYSLKRLVFIMECAVDAGLEVTEGDTATVLCDIEGPVFCARPYHAHWRSVLDEVRETRDIKVVRDRTFARVGEGTDLKRFFRYWKKARKSAMNPGG